MARKLKVWNGRLFVPNGEKRGSNPANCTRQLYVCVCAHSMVDLIRVISEYLVSIDESPYHGITGNEINNYWSECWGRSMDGVEPERGLWIAFEDHREPPTRVL